MTKPSVRNLLAAGALAGGLPWASSAHAADPTPAAEPQSDVIVVTVTANKVSENVRTVDTAASVVTGSTLVSQGRDQLADYVANMPGVTVNTLGSAGQASITIRGIPPLTSGSKVATYIDDAPLGSSGIWAAQSNFQLDLLPFDLDRIELLRGPQGTLYGAGSMGGLLKYVLLTPDTMKFSGAAGLDLSATDGAREPGETVQGRLNVPIKEGMLGVSLSGFYEHAPGYIDNAYDGGSDVNSNARYGGRLAVAFYPTDDVSVKFNALSQRINSKDDASISLLNPTQVTQPDGSILVSGGTSPGRLAEDKAFLAPFKSDVDFYSATVDWTPGSLEFVSATSVSRNHVVHVADNSLSYGSYFPLLGLPAGLVQSTLDVRLNKFTQELRVSTPANRPLSGLLGVFYTNENATDDQFVSGFDTSYQPVAALQPYAGFSHIPTNYREYAIFGNAVWKVSQKFELSSGVRFSRNTQRFDIDASGALLGLPQSPPTVLPSVRSDDNNTTYKASAKYQFSDTVMMYARASTGYAPGGANTPYPGVPASVDSERLKSYEVGFRSQFFDRKLTLDLAGYHIDWNDIQLPATSNNVGYTENGGRATSNGFELSSIVSPTSHLNIDFSAAYTDAELVSVASNVSTPFVLHSQLLLVPKWTLAISPDYAWSVGDWAAHAGAVIRRVGEQYGVEKVVGQPYFVLPSSTLVDLNASFSKGPFTFRTYVRNLTNRLAPTTGFLNTDVTGNTVQTDLATTQPRTIGAGVIWKF